MLIPGEGFVTAGALVQFLTLVSKLVAFQLVSSGELLPTRVTLIPSFLGWRLSVSLQNLKTSNKSTIISR